MAEEQQQQAAAPQRTATVVTSENLAAFNAQKLGLAAPGSDEGSAEGNDGDGEQGGDAADTSQEGQQDGDGDAGKEEGDATKPKKNKIQERFSKVTKQRDEANARERAAQERAAEAERRLAEVLAKLNPPEKQQQDDTRQQAEQRPGKPNPADYTDAFKYAEDLTAWNVAEALRQRDEEAAKAKEEAERGVKFKAWNERQAEIRKEVPDYDEVLAASTVVVSNEVRDAIIESSIGPKILHYLATHEEEAAQMAQMSVAGALVRLGKIEAKLEKAASAGDTAPDKQQSGKAPLSAVSKAPPPITPVRATMNSGHALVDGNGNFTGTAEQYRELRRAGKIK